MRYALSIDWLAFYCTSESGLICEHVDRWTYKHATHGTRQFKQLVYVQMDGEEFAEVQQEPCSNILKKGSIIVKFCNRFLYSRGLWYLVDKFMESHQLQVQNISRIDICADFNTFANGLQPISLISRFLSSEYRHIGRGIGASYFNHFAKRDGKYSKSYLNYTGLSFGSKKSDCKAYLYNKSFELLTVKDKPHIRQLWRESGLTCDGSRDVWRLEISISSKGMRFKDKTTGEKYTISRDKVGENCELSRIYFAFVKSLFSFVVNRPNITNISREPRIELFNGEAYICRSVLGSEDEGNRTERILIKQLWQMCETYRGNDIVEDEGISKLLAQNLAQSCGLSEWLGKKIIMWDKPKKK